MKKNYKFTKWMLGSKIKKGVAASPSIYFWGPTAVKSSGEGITVADIILF